MPTEILHTINDELCRSFQTSLEFVGKRWNSAILMALHQGATRFSEITAAVEGLSDRLLSARMKELEREGVVEREVIATTPVQIRYRLTERGSDLMQALQPMVSWGERWG